MVASMCAFASREIRWSTPRSRTTVNAHGCEFTALGACMAASINLRMVAASTGSASNSRTARRPKIASLTSTVASLLVREAGYDGPGRDALRPIKWRARSSLLRKAKAKGIVRPGFGQGKMAGESEWGARCELSACWG
jgi:hypothetical protein